MKKILQLILLITLTTSCEQSKKYEYVEIGLKESLFGGTERDEKNTVTIRAKNDSIAYLKETVKNNKQKEIEDFKKMVQIDSTKIKKLDKFFTSETDEFDPNALVWYIE